MTPARKKLVLCSLPVVVLVVVVAIKLIGMMVVSSLASSAYAQGDYERATSLARWQTIVNVIDPWKAHFAVGDGLAAQNLDPQAQIEFERSLELASPVDECPVRVNLVVVLERQGDAVIAADAGNTSGAAAFYDGALGVIEDADDSCLAPPNDEGEGTDEQLNESKQRLEAKKEALAGDPADTGDQENGAAEQAPPDATVKQLQDKLSDSGQDRSDQQTADRSPAQPGSVDKPW